MVQAAGYAAEVMSEQTMTHTHGCVIEGQLCSGLRVLLVLNLLSQIQLYGTGGTIGKAQFKPRVSTL